MWDHWAAADPYWSVLTEPDRRDHGWDADLDAFYATGPAAVASMLALVPGPVKGGRALDWGSGTGRLALALAADFEEVLAVDVSEGMLALTARRAREQGIPGVITQHVDDYRPARDRDLVISQLVLQHLASRREVAEALRLMAASLAPGGWLVVEAPTGATDIRGLVQPKVRLYRLLRALGVPAHSLAPLRLSGISTLTVPRDFVLETLRSSGLSAWSSPDRSDGFHYMRYVARAPGRSPGT